MNRNARLVLTVALVLGLSVLAMLFAERTGAGTDDQAAKAVADLSGGTFEPWAQSPGVPGGEQNASILFGVQAGAGLALLAGCLWYWREHRSGA
jgi:ABC-type cobalt transport system substrate-binding protein